MKRFMYLSIGILCLALAALIGFHVGSQAVQAQGTGIIVDFEIDSGGKHIVVLDNGDVHYRSEPNYSGGETTYQTPPHCLGNIFGGSLPTTDKTWGGIKGQYEGRIDPPILPVA